MVHCTNHKRLLTRFLVFLWTVRNSGVSLKKRRISECRWWLGKNGNFLLLSNPLFVLNPEEVSSPGLSLFSCMWSQFNKNYINIFVISETIPMTTVYFVGIPWRLGTPSDWRQVWEASGHVTATGGGAYEARRLVPPQNLGPGMERASP